MRGVWPNKCLIVRLWVFTWSINSSLGIQKSQTVVISFAEKFHAAGVGQLLERGQYLRRKLFELLKQYAGDAIGYLEFSLVFADKLKHQFIRGKVAFVGDFPAYFGVLIIVEVVIAAVKNVIMP